MNIDLMHYLSVCVTVPLVVAVLQAVCGPMIRAELRRLQRRDGDSFRRARASVDGRAPEGRAATDTPADRPREGGKDYEPRPQGYLARRRIAYHLIALLTVMIFLLLAMVAFGVIEVGDVDKFGVIVAPIVTLVTAATSSYFANRPSS